MLILIDSRKARSHCRLTAGSVDETASLFTGGICFETFRRTLATHTNVEMKLGQKFRELWKGFTVPERKEKTSLRSIYSDIHIPTLTPDSALDSCT